MYLTQECQELGRTKWPSEPRPPEPGLGSGRLGLGGRLHGLLVGPDLAERLLVDDVRHRERATPRRRTSPPPPASRAAARRAACRAGPRRSAPSARRTPAAPPPASAARRPVGADFHTARGVAVVLLHDQPGQVLDPRRHRLRVPVQGRPFGENQGQLVRVELGQLRDGRLVPEPPTGPRRAEARSSGTCWSSSMAMSRASGLRVSSSLASASTGIQIVTTSSRYARCAQDPHPRPAPSSGAAKSPMRR